MPLVVLSMPIDEFVIAAEMNLGKPRAVSFSGEGIAPPGGSGAPGFRDALNMFGDAPVVPAGSMTAAGLQAGELSAA